MGRNTLKDVFVPAFRKHAGTIHIRVKKNIDTVLKVCYNSVVVADKYVIINRY